MEGFVSGHTGQIRLLFRQSLGGDRQAYNISYCEERKYLRLASSWNRAVWVDIVLISLGITLFGCGSWLELWLRWLIYLLGFTLCLAGFFLICKDLLSALELPEEPTPEQPEPEGVYLGSFDLNGYSFRAYERKIANGSGQFRLISFLPLSPQREAAFIRYIVNEGLIENIWRDKSRQIEEEANWAFFQ
jgi:hypothetical protein